MHRLRLLVAILTVFALLVACAEPAPPAATPPAETPAVTPDVTPPVDATPVPEEPTPTPAEATPTPSTDVTPTPPAEMTPTPAPDETPTAPTELRTAEEAALWAAENEEIGGTVSIIAEWGGAEQESFLAMLAPFQQATGIEVDYTGTRDIRAILITRVEAGNPPDVAVPANPGIMRQFQEQGALVDLSDVLDMDAYEEGYTETWIELGTVDDEVVGVFMKAAVKGLIWYDPNQWDDLGLEIPDTWDEMMEISQTVIDETGTTPWSVALESGAASGWPGTDWIEDIVLRQSGQEIYDQWWQGELEWTSDEIRMAWETWGEIVGDPEMVYGGASTMLTQPFGNVGDPLFTDPPDAYMAHQASFIADFIQENHPDLEPIEDFDFFRFPVFEEGDTAAQIIAGDVMVMFNDTPQARALVRYLSTPEAQAIWAERGGGYLAPNQNVPLDVYPDEVTRQSAQILQEAEVVVFDASDLMPEALNNLFFSSILNFVQAPETLDAILEELEAMRMDAYNN